MFYVIEVLSIYNSFNYWDNALTLPRIRRLNETEVFELVFSYLGILLPTETDTMTNLFLNLNSEFDSIFAWINETNNEGNVISYIIRLSKAKSIKDKTIKSIYCQWPSCLCLSAYHLQLDSISCCPSSLSVVPIKFMKYYYKPLTVLDASIYLLNLYKTKNKAIDLCDAKHKEVFEHYCLFHRSSALIIADIFGINLYSLYHFLSY